MSKVRVYDLAKEFGLKSKELADKLVAMGYPVASHSSSVDEDMATDIRKKILGEGVAVTADGRIGLRGRPADIYPAVADFGLKAPCWWLCGRDGPLY